MKKVYTILAILATTASFAKTYTVGSGKWSDSKVWNNEYVGATIHANDVVIVTGNMTVNTSLVVEGTLQVEKGASLVGMKDLVIAKGGKFVNNGNTVLKNIINEGTVNNNMIMEAMGNIENRASIDNNNNMVAGNNFSNISGTAAGKSGAYFVNNVISNSTTAKFGSDVRVFYGNAIENAAATSTTATLNANLKNNAVELSLAGELSNVSLYSVEKSNDGKNFQLVDMVSASANGFNYTDTKINSDITYYRVKAISTMGEETTLPIASAKAPFANAYSMVTE